MNAVSSPIDAYPARQEYQVVAFQRNETTRYPIIFTATSPIVAFDSDDTKKAGITVAFDSDDTKKASITVAFDSDDTNWKELPH